MDGTERVPEAASLIEKRDALGMTDLDPRPQATSSPKLHEQDLELVHRILADDTPAWEEFVHRYAGLLYSVVRRYLRTRDVDDVRSVLVDVLVSLRRTKLRTYEGRASLSTWLTLVARSQALEVLRRRFGRGQDVKGCEQLSPSERKLFRLYHIEGRSHREVIREFERSGEEWTLERFVAALRTVERKLGDRWLRRLAYDLHAQSVGAASGRLLEYLDHVREEFQHQPGGHSPEYHLMEKEARHTVQRLTERIAELPPDERRILQLRFERGWTAQKIAEELGLPSARGVYSITERIVRRLRRWFGEEQ